MAHQFGLPKDWRPPETNAPPKRGKRSKARRDYLISALWGLLDGETLKGLTGVEKSVLICVATWASWETGEVRLSRGSLAKHTGHDEGTCRRAVASLVNRGVLKVARQGADGRGNATIYAIEKQGRRRSETGAPALRNRGAGAPPNKDHPRMIQGGPAEAGPPGGGAASPSASIRPASFQIDRHAGEGSR